MVERENKNNIGVYGWIDSIDVNGISGFILDIEKGENIVEIYLNDIKLIEKAADIYRDDLKDILNINNKVKCGFFVPWIDINIPVENFITITNFDIKVVHKGTGMILRKKEEVRGEYMDELHNKSLEKITAKLKGCIDGIEGDYIIGWAYNEKNKQETLKVKIYVDDQVVAQGIADIYREDLFKAGFGNGKHGFRLKISNSFLKRNWGEEKEFQLRFQNIVISTRKLVVPYNYKGYIEKIYTINNANVILLVGWVILPKGEELYIELNFNGTFYEINNYKIFRYFRADILNAFPEESTSKDGFVILIETENIPHALDSLTGVSLLGQKTKNIIHNKNEIEKLKICQISDLKNLTEILKSIYIAVEDEKEEKLVEIDIPLTSKVAGIIRENFNKYPVSSFMFGNILDNPKASIIIPLYKEIIFVENQLIEFERDRWLIQNCELIYVIDDPSIMNSGFKNYMDHLQKLYNVPCKLIYGHINRGFSPSNNLGAKYSRGEFLIFMNSDVIPTEPGWSKNLIEFLEKEKDAGAVAPMLIFPNGSIQHVGMELFYMPAFNSYFNHHIYMGFSPDECIKNEKPIEVDMITGALVCISRDFFYKIGGWDESYIRGDFEDSDLSLRIKKEGKNIYILPNVRLYHLEGGSQGFTEDRFYLTLMNSYVLKLKHNIGGSNEI